MAPQDTYITIPRPVIVSFQDKEGLKLPINRPLNKKIILDHPGGTKVIQREFPVLNVHVPFTIHVETLSSR